MPTKHVMHVTFDMRIGGTEMVIKNIIEGFSEQSSFKMSVFCIEEPIGPWGKDLLAEGISITSKNRRPGFDVSLISAIRKAVIDNQVDILHCHQYTPWVYGVFASIGLKCKVIFTEHGRFYPDTTSWKRKLINPVLLSFTDKVTAISKATAKALTEFEYIPAKRIDVIYNGIKPLKEDVIACRNDAVKKFDIDPDALILGTVARFDPIKNHPMMIRATAELVKQHHKVHLVLVGDGETRNELEELVSNLGIEKFVTFTGYQAYPSKLIAAFDVFLLTSFSEGTSMTLLEAMSLGKPCIVTNVGGNPEIVLDDVNGYCVGSDEDKALVKLCNDLLLKPDKAMNLSTESRLRFDKNFTAEAMNNYFKSKYLS